MTQRKPMVVTVSALVAVLAIGFRPVPDAPAPQPSAEEVEAAAHFAAIDAGLTKEAKPRR
jgi:hypothetical protein